MKTDEIKADINIRPDEFEAVKRSQVIRLTDGTEYVRKDIASKAMEEYARKELASLKEVVKELIPMAEDCDGIGYLHVSEAHYPKEVREARRMQAVINRAKTLL